MCTPVVWSVRVRAFYRGLFVRVWVWGFKWRLWVMPWTGSSFAWGEIPEQAAICWQMQQNGQNIYRLLLNRALRSSSTLQASRRADGAHLGEVLNADSRSAVLNRLLALMKASQHSPSSVGCSWWRRKIVRCNESYFFPSYPSFQILLHKQINEGSLNNSSSPCFVLPPVFLKQASPPPRPLYLSRSMEFMQCNIHRFFSSVLFSHYLLCQSHAAGLWKGGVFGVIFRCNRNTEGRVAWLEGERDRHNSAESCLKSEPQIFGSWLYTTLELPAPLRFQTHEMGNSIPPPRQKELERKGKRNWTG